MDTVFIYTLEHPLTGEIRYVGKTKNPKMRFHNHCNKLHNEKTHKRNWINSLKNFSLRPVMRILDEVDSLEWRFWERYWIAQIKSWGFSLVNHTRGGDGLTMGNQTSFQKGHSPWNKGVAKPKILKGKKGKSGRTIETQFIIGFTPWNKNRNGYKLGGLKQSRQVEQYSLDGELVSTFPGCKEAATALNCMPESIRRCCVGLSKTARGFIFKYKTT